jgi:hypothetical protein
VLRSRFETDQGAEAFWILMCEMQHDAAADRAAHGDRLVDAERVRDLEDHTHIIA